VGRRVVHPNYTGDLFAGYDIGLAFLSAPVANVAPAGRFRGADERGMAATSVGFGQTGNGATGAVPGTAGTKRAGTNVIDAFGGDTTTTGTGGTLGLAGVSDRVAFVDFDNPRSAADSAMGSPAPTDLELLIAPGDSGGGAAFGDVNGAQVVVGVHSFGASVDGLTNSDYGDLAGFTRVAPFNDFIDANVPEPSAAAAVLVAAGVLAAARRRRRRPAAGWAPGR